MVLNSGSESGILNRRIFQDGSALGSPSGNFQSSLRDFRLSNLYPGLRPGLSSAVPAGLILESLGSPARALSPYHPSLGLTRLAFPRRIPGLKARPGAPFAFPGLNGLEFGRCGDVQARISSAFHSRAIAVSMQSGQATRSGPPSMRLLASYGESRCGRFRRLADGSPREARSWRRSEQ
jgi:hypothetical protein